MIFCAWNITVCTYCEEKDVRSSLQTGNAKQQYAKSSELLVQDRFVFWLFTLCLQKTVLFFLAASLLALWETPS